MSNNTKLPYEEPELSLFEIKTLGIICESLTLGDPGQPGGGESLGNPFLF